MATAQIEHNHTARSHDEARQLFRFAQTAFSQRFQRSRKNLLCKVFRSAFVSQVTESVEPNPWGHTVNSSLSAAVSIPLPIRRTRSASLISRSIINTFMCNGEATHYT